MLRETGMKAGDSRQRNAEGLTRTGARLVDEITWEPEEWCEQARRLTKPGGRGDCEPLARLLELIDAGIRLRRPLDLRPPGAESEGCRRAILRGLTELRKAVGETLNAREP